MSYYYDFSLGKINENGKIELYQKCKNFYCRSRSFFDGDSVIEFMNRGSLVNEEENEYCDVFYLQGSKVHGNCGLIDGYISLEDAERYEELKDSYSFNEIDISVISKEMYCGMSPEVRNKYVRIVRCDTNTFDFVCSMANEIADAALSFEEQDNWCLVCIGG